MNHISYSIVIPLYKSNQHLSSLIQVITENKLLQHNTELIFVIDGCKEEYALEAKLHKYPSWKVVYLKKNFGQNTATLCGLALTSGEKIITMDADMYTIDNLFNTTFPFSEELVYGELFYTQKHFYRRVGSLAHSWMVKQMLGFDLGLHNGSSYRIMSASLKNKLLSSIANPSYIDVRLLQLALNYQFVKLNVRNKQRSSYTLFSLFKEFCRLSLSFLTSSNTNTLPFPFPNYIDSIKQS